MKKVFLILSFITLFSVNAFAKSDIQLRGELFHIYDTNNISLLPVSLGQYNFFGEKQNFGFGEVLDYGNLNIFSDTTVGILVGPAYGVNLGKNKRTRFQVISGLNFSYSTDSKPLHTIKGNPDIDFVDSTDSLCFSWGNDLQFKFVADLRCSFVMGIRAGVGGVYVIDKQTPSSKDADTTFFPQKRTEWSSAFITSQYIGLSINF